MVFSQSLPNPPEYANTSATLIDHIYTNNITSGHSGIIITVAHHFGTYYLSHDKNTTSMPLIK